MSINWVLLYQKYTIISFRLRYLKSLRLTIFVTISFFILKTYNNTGPITCYTLWISWICHRSSLIPQTKDYTTQEKYKRQ